jgi:transcriptional regulator with XRE-family HTH domain
VKRYCYVERDYAFGQLMLTLRTSIGLTQAGLADLLGVSRNAVGEWESGSSYPKAEHLKHFIALGVQQQCFGAGREADEIRALWRAAHQKVLLDEPWLQELLGQQASPRVPVPAAQTHGADRVSAPPAVGEPRVDWGEALDVPSFYGRQEELALLSRWVGEQCCRVVSVLGIGGIGKSALAVTLMHRVARQFEVVIWRSLRDAPGCSALLDACLQVLAPQRLGDLSDSLEERLRLLMEQLRARRVLLVLDNLETLLEEGEGAGRMRAGYEGYARLLRRIGETAHQSCLLLTSREKPACLMALEGSRSPVRALRLAGLDGRAGAQLLAEKDVMGSPYDRVRLVEMYQGNPLALQIVAQTIVELFGGEIVPFLEQGEVVFGRVRELLDEQFNRLSALEQSVFSRLAILREPVSLEELLSALSVPRPPMQVLEALDGLGRRSLIERGQRAGSFTLQSLALEYATARLIAPSTRPNTYPGSVASLW